MDAWNPYLAPAPAGTTAYTNFPTVLIAGHSLMLRRRWPEDLREGERSREMPLPLMRHFGTEGEVLTLVDAQGQTLAALRVRIHRNEPLPESGSAAWPGRLSSLRTAMRYSRLGWLEVGPITEAETAEKPAKTVSHFVATLIWQGLTRLMDRNGLGFAVGLCIAPTGSAFAAVKPETAQGRASVTDKLPWLLEKYGMDPDFAYTPGKFSAVTAPQGKGESSAEPHDDAGRAAGDLTALLPCDLREALRRGARLGGEPVLDAEGRAFFFWAMARA